MTTRRETPLDAARIVQVLAEHHVDYVLIGGLAVQAHGHVRTTQDADIFPAPGLTNAERLLSALADLGARSLDPDVVHPLDVKLLESAATLPLDSDAGGIDIHRDPPGAPPYDQLRHRALVLEVVGVEIAVADLDDLIAMKRASRRPIDIGDITALTSSESGESS